MDNNGSDAAQHPDERGQSRQSPRVRYLSIDILRAVALLLMIQVHAVDSFSEKLSSLGNLFFMSELLGFMPAPLFTLLVGLSYSLWLGAQRRSGRSADEIVKYSLRRGLFVFALGFLVNVFVWLPASTFDWDILALIGASAIILTWVRNWRPSILIALSVVILLASPALRDLSQYASYWENYEYHYANNVSDIVLGLLLNAYFPLLPWLIYPLIGFALGQMFYRDDKEASLPLSLLLVGVLLFAIAVVGTWIDPYVPDWVATYYATSWPDVFYPAVTTYLIGSLGVTFMALWVTNRMIDLNKEVTGRGPVLTFFRRYSYFALTGYVVHLAVLLWPLWIIGWWQGLKNIDYYQGRALSAPVALALALVLVIVLYLYMIFLDRHRKYSLEYFMRWIST